MRCTTTRFHCIPPNATSFRIAYLKVLKRISKPADYSWSNFFFEILHCHKPCGPASNKKFPQSRMLRKCSLYYRKKDRKPSVKELKRRVFLITSASSVKALPIASCNMKVLK